MNTIKLQNVQIPCLKNYETQAYSNICSIASEENSVVPDSLSYIKYFILLVVLTNFSRVLYDASNFVYISGIFNISCLLVLHRCAMCVIELVALERFPPSPSLPLLICLYYKVYYCRTFECHFT